MTSRNYLELKTRVVICFISLFTFTAMLFLGFFLFNFNWAWIIIVFICFIILMSIQLFLKFFFKKTHNCPQCNHSVSIYSEYCPSCGFQLLKKCHNCGNLMRYAEQICPRCRTKSKLLIIPDNAKVELNNYKNEEKEPKKNHHY
ncbi:MAG: hypothetical protein EU547_02400 [Promethearchaeota archaeon]|nr:MAG: hypothetical protein EU547_02400 [Candidatus Lokiarchaeota archaeon]